MSRGEIVLQLVNHTTYRRGHIGSMIYQAPAEPPTTDLPVFLSEHRARMTSFIGLDMAWQVDGNHSGIAVMEGDAHEVCLAAISREVTSMAAVVDFIAAHSPSDAVVAIDAPLVVKNTTGQRDCERLISTRFGKYDASCHTSNLGRPHATTGMKLVGDLEKSGFAHNFDLTKAKQRSGKWVFEVYPHPAMVRLFRLDRTIKYKKRTPPQKRAGLAILAEGQQVGYDIIENGGRLSADLKALKEATDEAPRSNLTLQSLGSSGGDGRSPTSKLWQMLDMVKLEDWDLARSLMTQELLKLDR